MTLIAFLAVLAVFGIYWRSVKDRNGLLYLYELFKEKLTREQFYDLARRMLLYAFIIALAVLLISFLAYITPIAFDRHTPTPVSVPRPSYLNDSPEVRLDLTREYDFYLSELANLSDGMCTELRNWEEIKSNDEREEMLKFSERFVLCPQQFVSESIPANGANDSFGKGIPFNVEMKKGSSPK